MCNEMGQHLHSQKCAKLAESYSLMKRLRMLVAYGARRLQAASMCSQTEAWDTSRSIADLLSTSGALHKHPELQVT